jgi:methylenetetrahydrofolate reductase (NADPH)
MDHISDRKETVMFDFPYLIEILTPKRSDSHQIEERMAAFAGRYRRILASGCGVSIPDNPMGQPRYSALEAIQYCGLSLHPERTVMNLNTFHTKEDLDGLLNKAVEMGLKYLLIVRGDGGPDLSKLDPGTIGGKANVATSMDLLRYINWAHPGRFTTGTAFNPYNPMPFEADRLRKKVEAGGAFVITQPVIGKDPNVDRIIAAFDVPVVIEAWMSKNVELLFKSIRKEKKERESDFDPIKNLALLHEMYPTNCVYLSMLGFKQDWMAILPRLKVTGRD